ncbi:sel1 repeat family protein [Campylobacter troglodytis]|uniref:sel1 repeat family protein n=1 Tax=Campylobacter troglodytis TaxID=654363 RepID=UPI001158D75F|nr:sel1 repeat family protein [Campylobacter troglodytis]TQR60324.1 hypothetical protein DMC01_06305 [Campylobacter troglodytis]
MANLSKLLNLAVFSIALLFMFNACESKEKLYQQCYYSLFNDDNRTVEQIQKDDEQCFKLAQLEEKDENFKQAIFHYVRACEINTPDNACEHLTLSATKLADRGIGMVFKECKEYENGTFCEKHDIDDFFERLCQQGNKNACIELKKAKLSKTKEYYSGEFIDDMDKMCKENLAKACNERDKEIEKSINDDLQEWRKHKQSDFYYIGHLDKFCRWEGLNSQLSHRACAGRDEIINAHEKLCDENNATSCEVLTLAYYDFFHKDKFDKDSYESEDDKIYPPKFKKAAQKACDLGEITGCEYLAYFYYDYKPELNYTLARQYGKKVALMLQNAKKRSDYLNSNPLVLFAYAEARADDELRKQFILDYFKLACDELQIAKHCLSFGHFYDGETNFGMSELISQKQALHYYDKACALGEDCMHLGQIYLFGKAVGGKKVKKDIAKARHYFAKDCENIGGFCSDACSDTDDTSCHLKQMSLKELGKIKEIRSKWEELESGWNGW